MGQLFILARCYIEFGSDFPSMYPQAIAILSSTELSSWGKTSKLEGCLPKGISRREFLKLSVKTDFNI